MILSGEVLVEFRSSERSWFWRCESVYKHVTPPGVESSLMNFQTWPDRVHLPDLRGNGS
jgi:hypothetical protein